LTDEQKVNLPTPNTKEIASPPQGFVPVLQVDEDTKVGALGLS
jgi:hypothetical protein